MDRVIATLVGVGVAVGGSALIFIGANKLFDLAPRGWRWFTTAIGATTGLVAFAILWGNRVIFQREGMPPEWVWLLLAGLVGAVAGYLLGSLRDWWARMIVGAAGGAVLGFLVGLNMRNVILVVPDGNAQREIATPIPSINYGELFLWVGIGLAVGVALWAVRGRTRPLWRGLVLWATVGWLFGAFLTPELNTGLRSNAILASTILGLGIGATIGAWPLADKQTHDRVESGSRKYIFLGPALFFIAASLVIPSIRTVILSFLDGRGEEAVGFANYATIFTDANILDLSTWTDIFTSSLFIGGVVVAGLGLAAAWFVGRARSETFDFGPSNLSLVALGLVLIAFAMFSILRGTIINNLWWVFTVTAFATAAGLAVAVLADRSRSESFAKSIIFMPMAISFVGAGIIWRFMYIARPPVRDQTGVMNALWVWLGQISNDSTDTAIVVTVLTLVVIGLGYISFRGFRSGVDGVAWGSIVTTLPLIWLIYRFLGPGLGGFEIVEATGEIVGQPIQFTSERPFNNFWLMVVLIWIQTGFSMVIFSAAIKGVPAELLEAAKVDGATESQSFWRVTVPQIMPTIGVVVTTLIVTVMKVFDIVRVMTAGNFDTNVIANEFYDKAFTEFNFGVGSSLATVLLLFILPILVYNIRQMQKAAV